MSTIAASSTIREPQQQPHRIEAAPPSEKESGVTLTPHPDGREIDQPKESQRQLWTELSRRLASRTLDRPGWRRLPPTDRGSQSVQTAGSETARSAPETALSGARSSFPTREKRQLFAGSGGGCIVAPGSGNGRARGWRSRFGSSCGCGSPAGASGAGNTDASSSPAIRRSN